MKEENVIGQWAICVQGKLGKIDGRSPDGTWRGFRIDGSRWQSKEPKLLCDQDSLELDQYLAMLPG